jgi:hypothetical protein
MMNAMIDDGSSSNYEEIRLTLHRFRLQDLCQVFILKNIHNPFASS